jgi:hypothetical protein
MITKEFRVIKNRYKYWYRERLLHRDNDQPAVIHSTGEQFWYQNGFLHRDNGPAAIYENGIVLEWYRYGQYITGSSTDF